MSSKFAFLTPLHPKHFQFGYHILRHYDKYGIKHCFIFSTEEEYQLFLSGCEYDVLHHMIPIVITHNIDHVISIVTFKKWYGLYYIHQHYSDEYDYIITTDAEIDFIEENFDPKHIYSRCEYIFENKKFYGGRFDHHHCYLSRINNHSLYTLQNIPYDLVFKETDDLKIYLWMSDLNVYRVSDLGHFFECIQFDHHIQHRISYEVFDHATYQFYCILFHGFTVIDTTAITNYKWSLECFSADDMTPFYELYEQGYQFSCVWHKTLNHNETVKKWLIEKGVFMIYHLDRND